MTIEETFRARRELVISKLSQLEVDLAIITPGENLRYLTNYQALALERITALIVSQTNTWLLVPALEYHSAVERCPDLEILSWNETTDPYQLIQNLMPSAKRVMVDEKMPYFHVEKIQNQFNVQLQNFSKVISPLRMKKDAFEITKLREVSLSINKVHKELQQIPFRNRSEKAIAKDISELILKEHEKVDFVIVAAGPNSANPHHEPGERLVQSRDVVVIDIGGTSADGYCSDCTRTYVVDEVADEFRRDFQILLQAQQLGTSAAKAGIAAQDLDRKVRAELAKADLDKWFIHRLGHGIGMQTHEDPYLVEGNEQILEVGNVFSIEPGFYQPGKWGARIEDIVAIGEKECLNLNNFDHDLWILT
jgi:Xaa-Pro aminopeptidase